MTEEQQKFWFPAKRYGWGWGPANTWQGAIVQIGYIVLVIFGASYLLRRHETKLFWSSFLVLTVLLVLIHWLKGEKATWRWGGK